MESWRKVWREGIARHLTVKGLTALADALRSNDPRLLQGKTCEPPAGCSARLWPCDAACPIGLAGWKGLGLETSWEVEEFFAGVCCSTDKSMGEPAAVRYFLNWYDENPREEVFGLLLGEVERTLRNSNLMARK